MSRVKAISHNFDVTFIPGDITHEVGRDRVKTAVLNPFRLRATSPIAALDDFHRMMQRDFKIAHRYYVVKKLEKVSRTGVASNGREIRMEFDLPDTRTPDVTKKVQHKAETVDMPLYD